MKRFTIFYKGSVWGSAESPSKVMLWSLPEKAYLYCREASGVGRDVKWLRKDLTPVLPADVPKELQLLVLLME